jgi:hypothetical protein
MKNSVVQAALDGLSLARGFANGRPGGSTGGRLGGSSGHRPGGTLVELARTGEVGPVAAIPGTPGTASGSTGSQRSPGSAGSPDRSSQSRGLRHGVRAAHCALGSFIGRSAHAPGGTPIASGQKPRPVRRSGPQLCGLLPPRQLGVSRSSGSPLLPVQARAVPRVWLAARKVRSSIEVLVRWEARINHERRIGIGFRQERIRARCHEANLRPGPKPR